MSCSRKCNVHRRQHESFRLVFGVLWTLGSWRQLYDSNEILSVSCLQMEKLPVLTHKTMDWDNASCLKKNSGVYLKRTKENRFGKTALPFLPCGEKCENKFVLLQKSSIATYALSEENCIFQSTNPPTNALTVVSFHLSNAFRWLFFILHCPNSIKSKTIWIILINHIEMVTNAAGQNVMCYLTLLIVH